MYTLYSVVDGMIKAQRVHIVIVPVYLFVCLFEQKCKEDA